MQICSVCARCYSDAESVCVDPRHPELIHIAGRQVDMVAGYRVESRHEANGPVERYIAKQTETNADCIISIFPLKDTDPRDFLKDARSAASLFHPTIADIYESGTLENGDAFYIAESPKSATVRELLNQGIPPLLAAIQIVRETAEAVNAMHSKGLVHGAIRPESIAFDEDQSKERRTKLHFPDFGGVMCRSILSRRSTIDSAIDSVRYFAPEQLSGEGSTPRTDVYALGVVLFELLSGEPPFDAETAAELIDKIRNEHAPEIEINNFELRMLLTHTLMESLQKQPAFRQPTALAFARQMRHIEQLATHSLTPPAPHPGAIAQNERRVAEPVFDPSRSSTEMNTKRIDMATIDTLGPPPVEQGPETADVSPIPAFDKPTTDLKRAERAQTETSSELDRSRMRSWKEKYQAFSSAFRSETKRGPQPLSILDTQPRDPRAAVADPPKQTGTECDQRDNDVPTLDEVRKIQVERAARDNAAIEAVADPKVEEIRPGVPLPRNGRPERDLFAYYDARPRRRKAASIVRDLGLFSEHLPLVHNSSMNRRFIAAGFAVAVIVGLFFGSSLFEREEVRSAKPEASETKIVPPNSVETEPRKKQNIIEQEDVEPPAVVPHRLPDATDGRQRPRPEASKRTVGDSVKKPNEADSAPGVPTQAAVKQPSLKNPSATGLKPSTLVIYPANGKVESKLEPSKNEKNGPSITRPRIVANPKP